MAAYEYTCPCGGSLKTDSNRIFEEFIKDHKAAHIEKVLELKSKAISLPPIPMTHGEVVYTPCSCKTVVTG